MKDVYVIVYFSDEQWDVEVFRVENREIVEKLDQYTEYALGSEEELADYVKTIKDSYTILEVEHVNLDEREQSKLLNFEIPEPTYVCRFFNEQQDELQHLLQRFLLIQRGINAKLTVRCEHEYMYIGILEKDNSKETMAKINETYIKKDKRASIQNFTDLLLEDVFGEDVEYTYVERSGDILIQTPYYSPKTVVR